MRNSLARLFLLTLALCPVFVFAQVLDKAEYFIDQDPGAGNGIALTITPSATIDRDFNIPVPPLPNGFHSLNVRLRDSNGRWGHFASRYFYIITPVPVPVATNQVAMEYFIDQDPGIGSGTPVPISPGANIDANIVVPITSLQPGFHQLALRTRDNNGSWSHFAVRTFFIVEQSLQSSDATITQIEYFIDSDPGLGQGTPLSITSAPNQDQLFAIDISAVPTGFHLIGFRAKSNKGKWSHFATRTFFVLPPLATQEERINEIQYFVDTNPELNPMATPRIVAVSPTQSLDAGFAFDMTGITPGNHEVYVRVKSGKGLISAALNGSFTVIDCVPPSAPSATGASACAPAALNLTATGGSPGQTYRWYEDESTPVVLYEGSVFTTPVLSASRSYFVSLHDPSSTCESARTPVPVTFVSSIPSLNITGEVVICEGSSVVITAPDGFSSYLWSNGATTRQLIATTAGSYTVVVGNGTCESQPSLPAIVSVSLRPEKPVVAVSGALLCGGEPVTMTGPSGFSGYTWSNGAATSSVNTTAAGVYTLVVTNAAGCSSAASDPVVINSPPVAPDVFVVGNTTFCEGSATTLVGPSGFIYEWSNGKTTQAITESASGSYSLRVTDSFGCRSQPSGPVTLLSHPRPAAPVIAAVGATSFCPGQSVQLSGPAGVEYIWSSGETTQTITVSGTGSYSLLVRDVNNCVSAVSAPVVTTLLPCTTITARAPLIQDRIIVVQVDGSVTADLTNAVTDPDDDLDLSSIRVIEQPVSGARAAFEGPSLVLDYTGIEFAGMETLTIEVCDAARNCSRKDLQIQVVGNVVVYNAISPNGDGLNESLFFEYISLLDESKDNRVRIFNRSGELVYDATGYNNTSIAFSGTSTSGEVLPPGVYFFRIDFTSGIPVKTGYFSLRR